jgi:hypothetical protein
VTSYAAPAISFAAALPPAARISSTVGHASSPSSGGPTVTTSGIGFAASGGGSLPLIRAAIWSK